MILRLFEGVAGSGKTTRLFDAVAQHLAGHPLAQDQRILALTKIHGSRRRMRRKLVEVLGTRVPSECSTLNSFALRLVHRWRSLARTISGGLPEDADFTAITHLAAKLLERDTIGRWVAARYPTLVVDELQDLRDSDLAVVRGLARGLALLCAADDFQELDPQGSCEATAWARSAGESVSLDQVHRTSASGLLEAARRLRAGQALLPLNGTGFRVFSVANPNVAASFLAKNLTWWAGAGAVISPTGPDASLFVSNALARLAARPFEKDGKTYGPFTLRWEASAAEDRQRCEALLRLVDGVREVAAAEIISCSADLPGPLVEWVQSRARLSGRTSFSSTEVRAELARAHSLVRAHAPPRVLPRVGLTVHQAKNREFDRVIVLWPVKVGGGAEVRRRLLYNAITRAKRECLVLVQDPRPTESRLMLMPFR